MSQNNGIIGLLRWGPAVVLMAVIFLASSTTSSSMPNFGLADLLVKKGGHMVGYGLLALCFIRGIQRPTIKGLAVAFLLTTLYAVSDEFHQSFVAGRGSTWIDVVIDSAGALAALFLWTRWSLLRVLTATWTPNKGNSHDNNIPVGS